MKTWKLIAVFVMAMLLTATAIYVTNAVLSASSNHNSSGSNLGGSPVVSFVEYLNNSVLPAGSPLAFGSMYSGITYTSTLAVRNNGNVASNVALTVTALPLHWNLNWDPNATLLQPGDTAYWRFNGAD